ncbi:MAG TPA: hypothetical protein VIL20_13890 [Sandaracinaceae bacterium]
MSDAMRDDLERRISDAMDREGGLDADAELRAILAENPSALAYAQDLARIDAVLRSFAERRRREPDWDALAARIEARLDEPLEDLDVTSPPLFEDAGAPHRAREPAVSQEVPVAPAPGAQTATLPPSASSAAPAVAPSSERAPASVVPLAPRRRAPVLAWAGGLAAAAAVGLGILFGIGTLGAPSDRWAEAPAAEEGAAALRGAPEAAPVAPASPAPAPPAPAGAASAAAEPAAAALAMDVPARERDGAEGGLALLEAEPEPAAEPARYARPSGGAGLPAATGASARARRRAGSGVGAAGRALSDAERDERFAALRRAEPDVQRCLAGRGEPAHVMLDVDADGRVSSVRVAPPYAGGEAACIERALRALRLPASGTGRSVLAHTFRPAPPTGGPHARPAAAPGRVDRGFVR